MFNSFKLSQEGRAIVDVNIKPFDSNKLCPVDFKIDTGADITTIDKNILINELGYSPKWIGENIKKHSKRTITVAGGKEAPAYYVCIEISNILGHDLKNWAFFVTNFETKGEFPNLLGIDILHRFNINFNYNEGKFYIWPIAKSAIKIPLLENQEIHETKSIVEKH